MYGADVAEAAFLSVGHTSCGFIGHQLANEGSETLDELVGQRSPWESRSVRRVDDLADDPDVPLVREDEGQSVLADHFRTRCPSRPPDRSLRL